jgi:Fe-S oxidoreductase
MLQQKIVNDCLMCGRCEQVCPVGINLNTLRLNSRVTMRNTPNEGRYKYLKGIDTSQGEGKVGYFAGCMTLLTPKTLHSMQQIFDAAGEQVWWADKSGGVCCGRPMMLSGEVDAAQKMVEKNKELFRAHGITTLVTSCPICMRVFRENYALDGIEVLHHSEYILRLIKKGRLNIKHNAQQTFTYHDPCELGRGSNIYDEPRAVIEAIGQLIEPEHNRKNAFCCGSSVANTAISDAQQRTIAQKVGAELGMTGKVSELADNLKEAYLEAGETIAADLAKNSKLFGLRVGLFIYPPFQVVGCKWEFDTENTDEQGFPLKGSITFTLNSLGLGLPSEAKSGFGYTDSNTFKIEGY